MKLIENAAPGQLPRRPAAQLTLTPRRKVVKLPGLQRAVNRLSFPGERKILLLECSILPHPRQTHPSPATSGSLLWADASCCR